jgi:hypothetical protein
MTKRRKVPNHVKFEIAIQPNAKKHMLMALPNNNILAASEKQWPRLHRILWEIYRAERPGVL